MQHRGDAAGMKVVVTDVCSSAQDAVCVSVPAPAYLSVYMCEALKFSTWTLARSLMNDCRRSGSFQAASACFLFCLRVG